MDNSKELDCRELLVLFNVLGCKATKGQISNLTKDIDLDSSGKRLYIFCYLK